MEFSIVENLSRPQESIFSLVRRPQFHFGKKSNKWTNYIKIPPFPLLSLSGVLRWGHIVPGLAWLRRRDLEQLRASTDSAGASTVALCASHIALHRALAQNRQDAYSQKF